MCVLVLCGLPGAGKTSVCKHILESCVSVAGLRAHHVCIDEHVARASGVGASAFSPQAWKVRKETEAACSLDWAKRTAPWFDCNWQEGREGALQAVERLLKSACLPEGPAHTLVIIDDTMHYRSMRHECYQLARECELRVALCCFRCQLVLGGRLVEAVNA
jgi:tRNA uridine 5-carbamoylmethylation protein Kti12